jgi:hypothetical protein
MPRVLDLLCKRTMHLVIQENEENQTIKMSTVSIKYRKYKFICKEKHKIQPKYKENSNDHKRIYIVGTVRIYKQKHNIPPESKICVLYKMKKL